MLPYLHKLKDMYQSSFAHALPAGQILLPLLCCSPFLKYVTFCLPAWVSSNNGHAVLLCFLAIFTFLNVATV